MRRRYLWLLAVFVPTVLGLSALSYLFFAPQSHSEAAPSSPIVRQEPVVEDTISDETIVAPAETDGAAPSAPRDDETIELPETKSDGPQRPAQVEPSDIIGPPLLASSTASESGDGELAPTWNRRSIRLANLAAAGGGGGAPSTDAAKTASDDASTPVDVSNSGNDDASTPGSSNDAGGSNEPGVGSDTGGDTDPNGGKGEGESGAAPNVPTSNPDDDHDEDENSSGNGEEGGNDEEEEDPPVSDTDPSYPTDPFPHEDEHQPVQVPEPASFGLLLLGLAGCAVGRRRKN